MQTMCRGFVNGSAQHYLRRNSLIYSCALLTLGIAILQNFSFCYLKCILNQYRKP